MEYTAFNTTRGVCLYRVPYTGIGLSRKGIAMLVTKTDIKNKIYYIGGVHLTK